MAEAKKKEVKKRTTICVTREASDDFTILSKLLGISKGRLVGLSAKLLLATIDAASKGDLNSSPASSLFTRDAELVSLLYIILKTTGKEVTV